ncbi:MFS transporter [Pectobacterium cacticida]|uniref:MFS transporter n=1 Tax=Pectobacterium cacticida TaxID=69221 RepID=UPI0039879ECD
MRKYFRKRKISSEYIILIAAFIVISANLRSPLTALPAVIDDIRSDLHIDSVLAGTLTTIPVLCFGLLVPLVSIILKRVSIERAIFIVLLGVILGTLLRSFGDFTTIWVGTLLLGGALSLGNIVSLMVIARDFRHNSGLMTGIYVMAMSIGATLTSALTAPLASILGWQIALSCWSILALLGIVLWAKVNNNKKGAISTPKETPPSHSNPTELNTKIKPVWQRPLALLLSLSFAAHSFLFYGIIAWLPDYLVQSGIMTKTEAGGAASLFQIFGLLGCFGIPWLSSTLRFTPAALFLIVGISWFLTPAGLLVYPSLWLIWVIFGGIGSGGGFAVIFMQVITRAINLEDNRKISSFVQGIGYCISSLSAVVLGYLHTATGSWMTGFVFLSVVAIIMTISGLASSKIKTV